MSGFDVEGARKEGYSDDEIIQHLTTTRKFDVAGAVKEGYSKTEIIDHLKARPVAGKLPPGVSISDTSSHRAPAPDTISADHPSLWEKTKRVAARTVGTLPPVEALSGASKSFAGAAQYVKEQGQQMKPEEMEHPIIAKAYKNVIAPLGTASGNFLSGMAQPQNAAMMAAFGGIPVGTVAGKAFHAAIGSYFAGTMGIEGLKQAYASYKAASNGNVPEAVEQAMGSIFNLGMAGAGTKGTVDLVKGMKRPPVPPKAESVAARPPSPPIESPAAETATPSPEETVTAKPTGRSGATPKQIAWFAGQLKQGTFDELHAESVFGEHAHNAKKILSDMEADGLIEKVEPSKKGKKNLPGGWKLTAKGDTVRKHMGWLPELPADPESRLQAQGKPPKPPVIDDGPITDDDLGLPDSHAENPVRVDHDSNGNVVDGDGRHRIIAALQRGDETIPIQTKLADGTTQTLNVSPQVAAEKLGVTPESLRATDTQQAEFQGLKSPTEKPDNVRLYRGNEEPYSVDRLSDNADAGRWFVSRREAAEKYGKHVVSVDVPREQYEQMLADEEEFARISPGVAHTEGSVLLSSETAKRASQVDGGVPPNAAAEAGKPPAGEGQVSQPSASTPEATQGTLPIEEGNPGPGAQNRASNLTQQSMIQPRETETSHIEDLTNSLNSIGQASDRARQTLGERIARIRSGVAEMFHGTPDENDRQVASFWQDVKEAGGKTWEWWQTNGLESSDLKDATKDWQYQDQYLAQRLNDFVASIKKSVPNRKRREAITNWIQADGDHQLLAQRASASKPKYRQGYEDALSLNPDETVIANNIRNFQDAELQENLQTGILDHGKENYVQQIWKKIRNPQKFFSATANSSALAPNPSYAKKAVFPTYFDGEQAGFKPRNKDIAFLIANHHAEFSKALSARAYIASLMEGKASDGRPLAVLGGTGSVEGGGKMSEKYFVRPNANPEMSGDYRDINHPALRGWKSVASGEDGNRVILQGNMKIHPEAYKMIYNNLMPSALRGEIQVGPFRVRPGAAVLRASSEFKQILTANWLAAVPGMVHSPGFHQVTEAQHAAFHLTFKPVDKIEFNHPEQSGLIHGGLVASNFDGEYEFSEGMGANGGIVTKIPWAGPRIQENAHYLFQDLIPRLKMGMALHALERNRERYRGQLSESQIYELTAKQANAAFGELNYKLMGRNKTVQDVFRIVALAPDFLEARARFVGQAATPYGREQSSALLRGSLAIYVGARILNKLLDDDYHWDRPFSVIHQGREFEGRTAMGDVGRLVSDPLGRHGDAGWKQFAKNRLNPYLIKQPLEILFGKNDRGEKVGAAEQFGDFLRAVEPIPLQGWFNRQSETTTQKTIKSVFGSIGVNESTYRSRAEQMAHEIAQANPKKKHFYGTESPLLRSLFFAAYEGSLDVEKARKLSEAGKITPKDYSRMLRMNGEPQLRRDWKYVPEEKRAEVIFHMTAKEKQIVGAGSEAPPAPPQ